MVTALAVLQAIAALAGLLRQLLNMRESADDRQAGRDEVAAKTNAETVETKDAMDDVARPSDDAVADSLRRNEF
ncbi:hypothetical protein IVB12_15240 [Bradyrhizobium sp. 179]|uniref:hypothetical protein n=1 Tax=Bradyrhizobium sp. 179 TaxID=2782648 RepID=UPI001FF7E3E9|nr:hypothetical protein [Bradyrhizobium sp. 179]MCK1543269.1 hypothetical protein [Bradyrhizobium sp. 179]